MKSMTSFSVLFVALVALSVVLCGTVPADPPEAPAVSKFAPAAALGDQVEGYVEDMEEAVESKDEYEEHAREIQQRRREMRASQADEEQLEALFDEERERSTRLLAAETHAGKVGAFEGAMYQSKGLFRPSADCIMFTRNDVGFCPVCSRALERVIDLYTE